MEEKYIVYAHINKINNKKYIGITKRDPNKRWKNGKGYDYNEYFYNSIKKYSWSGFDHVILENDLTEEEAKEREKFYIKLWNTQDRDFGYNGDEGGGLPPVLRGDKNPYYHIRPEKAIEESVKKRTGCHLSEDHKKQISESLTNGKTSRKILCVETNIIYPSVAEVERQLGLNHSAIINSMKRNGTCGGYHWKYLE